jgi:centromere/kinetochore protein ZW10
MASDISDDVLGSVILHSVAYSSYPESEDVASAELPPSALTNLQKVLGEAREDVKVYTHSQLAQNGMQAYGWT